jgi:hypothetical protein
LRGSRRFRFRSRLVLVRVLSLSSLLDPPISSATYSLHQRSYKWTSLSCGTLVKSDVALLSYPLLKINSIGDIKKTQVAGSVVDFNHKSDIRRLFFLKLNSKYVLLIIISSKSPLVVVVIPERLVRYLLLLLLFHFFRLLPCE